MSNDLSMMFIQKITKLPTLPHVAQEIMHRLTDDMLNIEKLEEIIERDPAIAAKILSVANSPFFRSSVPVSSISTAVFRIGLNNVRNIAMGVALLTAFDDKQQGRPLDNKRVFRHSIAVGLLAKSLSRRFKLPNDSDVFSCGILHDLGFLVLNNYFADKYQPVITELGSGLPLLEAEAAVLKVSHAVVGTWLADNWNLPDAVYEAIQYHHAPTDKNSKMVSLIHITDFMVSRNFFSVTERDPLYKLEPKALAILGLTETDLLELESEVDRDMFSDSTMEI